MISAKEKDWTAIDQAVNDAIEDKPVIVEDRTLPGKPAARCPAKGCGSIACLTEHAVIKVHFANPADSAPCVGSYKRICNECGGLVHNVDGKTVHLTQPGECSLDAAVRLRDMPSRSR